MAFIPFIGLPFFIVGIMLLAMSEDSKSSLIAGIALIVVGLLIILINIACSLGRFCSSKSRGYKAEEEIIARHKATTFSGLQVIIRQSEYKTYLAIEFAWKGLGQAGGFIPAGAYQSHNASMMTNQQFNPYQPAPNFGY